MPMDHEMRALPVLAVTSLSTAWMNARKLNIHEYLVFLRYMVGLASRNARVLFVLSRRQLLVQRGA